MRLHSFSLLAALACSASVTSAQEAVDVQERVHPVAPKEAAQEREAAGEDERARSVRRILHFKNGGAVTGVARFVDGRWELKQKGGGWRQFPADQITRAPKEAEVQREKKRRAKALGAEGALADHAAFLEWLAGEGLYGDALHEAEAILERSPHHTGTIEFLTRRPMIALPSLDVDPEQRPGARAELYRWAAGATTAGREIAIDRLRRAGDLEAVRGELMEGLSDFSIRRRAFSAHALGRLFPGQEARRLLQHSVLDTSRDVRRQAAQALGGADQPGLITPVVRALSSSNIRVRVQAAEALGFMGYSAAVEPLVGYLAAAQSSGSNRVPHGYIFVGKQTAYVQDFDVEVATFQAVADPQVNVLLEGHVLEAGVSGVVEYRYATEAVAARTSLGRLTGADPGKSGSAWQKWWQENQASWKHAGLKAVASDS